MLLLTTFKLEILIRYEEKTSYNLNFYTKNMLPVDDVRIFHLLMLVFITIVYIKFLFFKKLMSKYFSMRGNIALLNILCSEFYLHVRS